MLIAAVETYAQMVAISSSLMLDGRFRWKLIQKQEMKHLHEDITLRLKATETVNLPASVLCTVS